VTEHREVDDHDNADEQLEQQDELSLRDQVRLARLVDQLGDLEHRLVHRHVLELAKDHQAEPEAEQTDHDADRQQGAAGRRAQEVHASQIGEHEGGFAAFVLRKHRGSRQKSQRRNQET